ncbi:MAG: hypothetical protein M1828_002118 [Chrysothrix sp. TS-e1954]|nr:MAG: hypothetical protein M1828_002118 [Chrysothrix sp. TS-e1954]
MRLGTCRALRPLFRPLSIRRQYAVQAPGTPTLEIFDRRTKYLQKERAASDVEASRRVDYLRDEVASRLCERLLDIKRHLPHVLDFGANACNIAKILTQPPPDVSRDPEATGSPQASVVPEQAPLATRISRITAADASPSMLHRDEELPFNSDPNMTITREALQDEETLPYPPETFDAVLSSLSLHWINDLPSVLRQINRCLKPDAPLLAAMFGGDSLFELRTSLQLADLDRRGGVSTHTSPLADVRDIGSLLQGAGFKLLTVDVDDIVVDYPNSFALMQDLQAMGESNAVLLRDKGPIQKDVLLANDSIYKQLHGNEDGSVPATFRMIYLIGWKEGSGQEKPLPRGSGQVNMKDILGGGDFGPG